MVTNAPSSERVSAKPLEEPGQELGRFPRQNALPHLGSMVQTDILRDVVERPCCARLGIGCPVDEGSEPGGHGRPGAHRAWLESDVQSVSGQPPVSRRPGRRRQDQHLGVGGRVGQFFPTIVIGGDLASVLIDQNRPDGNLTPVKSQPGLIEGETHPMFVFVASRTRRGHWRVDYDSPKHGRVRLQVGRVFGGIA
jgi:hypothetical protein